jgi:amino acid transporter
MDLPLALCMTIAAVAAGAAPYLAVLFGRSTADSTTTTIIALALLAISTILNLSGTKWLARMVMFGFLAELTGGLVVAAYLLMFWRVQPLHVLFDTFEIRIDGSYWPAPFLLPGSPVFFSITALKPAAILPRRCATRRSTFPKRCG